MSRYVERESVKANQKEIWRQTWRQLLPGIPPGEGPSLKTNCLCYRKWIFPFFCTYKSTSIQPKTDRPYAYYHEQTPSTSRCSARSRLKLKNCETPPKRIRNNYANTQQSTYKSTSIQPKTDRTYAYYHEQTPSTSRCSAWSRLKLKKLWNAAEENS